MRIAQLLVVPVADRRRGRGGRGDGDRARRRRLRLVGAPVRPEPRVRVSAILRWHGRILLCRHEKRGVEHWLLPGGGVRSGESLTQALQRELDEETGLIEDGDEIPVEGPVAIIDSISPERSLWSKHVVHIVFAAELDGSLADRRLARRGGARPPAVRSRRARGTRAPSADRPLPAPLPAGRPLCLPGVAVGAVAEPGRRSEPLAGVGRVFQRPRPRGPGNGRLAGRTRRGVVVRADNVRRLTAAGWQVGARPWHPPASSISASRARARESRARRTTSRWSACRSSGRPIPSRAKAFDEACATPTTSPPSLRPPTSRRSSGRRTVIAEAVAAVADSDPTRGRRRPLLRGQGPDRDRSPRCSRLAGVPDERRRRGLRRERSRRRSALGAAGSRRPTATRC